MTTAVLFSSLSSSSSAWQALPCNSLHAGYGPSLDFHVLIELSEKVSADGDYGNPLWQLREFLLYLPTILWSNDGELVWPTLQGTKASGGQRQAFHF